jgi:hypothetical protein
MNWYNNRLLPLIRQFFLIPNRINEFLDNFFWNLDATWQYIFFFNFAIAFLSSRQLRLDTNVSAA